ncbi:MAG: hypothetical protein AB1609_23555, partial [Bacillota bacterium]
MRLGQAEVGGAGAPVDVASHEHGAAASIVHLQEGFGGEPLGEIGGEASRQASFGGERRREGERGVDGVLPLQADAE